jgi:hypothetical protein
MFYSTGPSGIPVQKYGDKEGTGTNLLKTYSTNFI